jgi:2-polyprenyl-6-methoxyphenol hydroxylase-like FAD-dependent oxidoreductase
VHLNSALIIGGGIAGMSAAIELRKRGVPVDLVEVDKEWRVYGAGITINGAALRAFKALGVIDEIMRQGWCSDGCDLCGSNGTVFEKMPTPRIAGPEVPGGGGILRPVLARILSRATEAAGVKVRLGVTFDSIANSGQTAADVQFTDGSHARYDLVVGADGLYSKVRAALFPDSPVPAYTGQGSWRAVVPRWPAITNASIHMGAVTKAGVNPVSADEMYLFCLDQRATNARIPESELVPMLKGLLAEFSGTVGRLRDQLSADSRILYRPLEALLMPPPWHRGRVVLVGDAAHATTPHLAAGAALGVEDAIVLVEELERSTSVGSALESYVSRRFERCRLVVQNSLRLGEIEVTNGSKADHAQLMRESMTALMAPL